MHLSNGHLPLQHKELCKLDMQLWATGFNAWNQLNFERDAEDFLGNPDDIPVFKPILIDEHIEVVRTSLSSVLGKCTAA